VACSAERAFSVWTTHIAAWWPSDHTVSHEPGLAVVMEGIVGGRIYERTIDGVEHDWGEVTTWQPPRRLGYLWHLGAHRDAATEVEIRFVAVSAEMTRVEIEHRGWERLGVAAALWRDRNRAGWDSLIPHFLSAIAKGDH